MKNLLTTPFSLPAMHTWPATKHQFDQNSINAIEAAVYANRPLLIRGETGSGKSQLARAVATAWGRIFLSTVVNSRTDSQDLHYQFDAVERLADAQIANKFIEKKEDLATFLNPLKYVNPSVLWWVFNWQSAEDIVAIEGNPNKSISKPKIKEDQGNEREWQPDDGAVILIDEIDKAETDLPNDLLETLGNGAFTVPWIAEPISMQNQSPPLIMVTTNEERELPAAFVRRCVVLDLNPPEDEQKLVQWLCKRGAVHYADDCSEQNLKKAAKWLVNNREQARKKGVPLPGQAEYIDLLKVLCEHTKSEQDETIRDKKHNKLIEKISPYLYKKYPEMKQQG